MRTTREAHPQMREVLDPLLEEMKDYFPIIFEDIFAGDTQAENLKKMR
jgi:thymidylate synthase ThyX